MPPEYRAQSLARFSQTSLGEDLMTVNERSPTVLIVDDEALFRHSVVDALQDACPTLAILQAGNGREGLDQVNANQVDVLVTDISMPVMDGLDFMLRLRNQAFAGAVIVVTAFGDPMLRSEVAISGGFGYFEKPIDLPELIDTIRGATEGERRAIEGLSLTRFVRLLELERKTCRLQITKGEEEGDLLFRDGVLVDARLGSESGNEAAFELLSWNENVQLELHAESEWPASEDTVGKPPSNGVNVVGAKRNEQRQEQPLESDVTLETTKNRENEMGNVAECLGTAMGIDGAIGVALVDHESGMSLGQSGGGDALNLDVAGAGNTAVVRAKMRVMDDLGLGDSIEDILITLGKQYHLIRPLATAPNLFLYLALDRGKANLAMARHQLASVEKDLKV